MGKEFKYQKIERDEELIQNLIILEEHFWKNHVLTGCMPNPDGSESCDKMLAEYYKRSKKNSAIPLVGFDEKLKRREELDGLIKRMETERKEIDQNLKMFLGEHEIAQNDIYRVSWANVESSRLDVALLKEERPDIYEKYLRTSSSRRLSVKSAA